MRQAMRKKAGQVQCSYNCPAPTAIACLGGAVTDSDNTVWVPCQIGDYGNGITACTWLE